MAACRRHRAVAHGQPDGPCAPCRGDSPLEVSLYLGLATAIATFAASAVALGLLHCARPRDRILASGVLLCATLGVATALATIARARATGAGNVLIGVGLVTAAVSVLSRALHQIFTVRDANEAAHSFASTSSSTLVGRVSLVRPSDGEPPGNDRPAFAGLPGAAVLRRQLWLTSATFVGVAVLAAAIALPGLLPDVLRDRPVGSAGTATPPVVAGFGRHVATVGDRSGAEAIRGRRVNARCRWPARNVVAGCAENLADALTAMRHGTSTGPEPLPSHGFRRSDQFEVARSQRR